MSHHHHKRSCCRQESEPVRIAGICGTATLATLADQAAITTIPACSTTTATSPGARLSLDTNLFQFGTVSATAGANTGFTVCRPGNGSIYGLILFMQLATTCAVRVDTFFVPAGSATEQFVGSSTALAATASATVPQIVRISLPFTINCPGRFIFRLCSTGPSTTGAPCANTVLAGSEITLTETCCL